MTDALRSILASLVAGTAVAVAAWMIIRPPRRLAGRVRGYSPGARAALGASAEWHRDHDGGLRAVFGPVLGALGRGLSAVIDAEPEAVLRRRLAQARMFGGVDDSRRVAAYRARQLLSTGVGAGFGVLMGSVLSLSGSATTLVALLGVVVGSTRQRGRLDRAIEARQERMRIEIYTVNQLLALRVRSGGGVVQAIDELTARLNGEVADELTEGLRLMRAGTSASEALDRLADRTPEPHCARTYSVLATAEDRGADLADALLRLADDVRTARRESMRRRAVKRRAAMLIPTIGLMAPVLLLFIAAPLPRIVLGQF